jgi:hypothetical protein
MEEGCLKNENYSLSMLHHSLGIVEDHTGVALSFLACGVEFIAPEVQCSRLLSCFSVRENAVGVSVTSLIYLSACNAHLPCRLRHLVLKQATTSSWFLKMEKGRLKLIK